MNCPATRYLLQELQQQQIAYQFKDTDQPGVNEEYWRILRQANFNGKPVLPMVYVRSKVLMGPSIDQIRAVQSGQSATH